MMIIRKFAFILVLLMAAGPVFSSPRVLPRQQAARFCRLMVNDGEGRVYPLSVYARRLTMLICHDDHYGDYTAEQIFTGLIFFFDEWSREPMPYSRGQGRMLMDELHSGQTLRIFPHVQKRRVDWYAPTDKVPESVGLEHQKYIRESFARLNTLVQRGDWKLVDSFIDRMITYQCRFGSFQQ